MPNLTLVSVLQQAAYAGQVVTFYAVKQKKPGCGVGPYFSTAIGLVVHGPCNVGSKVYLFGYKGGVLQGLGRAGGLRYGLMLCMLNGLYTVGNQTNMAGSGLTVAQRVGGASSKGYGHRLAQAVALACKGNTRATTKAFFNNIVAQVPATCPVLPLIG